MAWTWWAVAVVLLLLAEGATATLAFAMAAAGAVFGGLFGALGAPAAAQLAAFATVSVGLLAFLRPLVVRRQNSRPGLRTGVAALVGADALVTVRVDAHSGRVSLAGQIWSARALDPDAVFEPGSTVQVAEIDGATALVF